MINFSLVKVKVLENSSFIKTILVMITVIVLLILLCDSYAHAKISNMTCKDFKKSGFLAFLQYMIGSKKIANFDVDFYISTKKNYNGTFIDMGHLSSLENSGFDPSLKTIILIHGYKSSGKKDWIKQLKNKLLDAVDSNIIIVDWSKGSDFPIYVNSARHTQVASSKILSFLEALRSQVERTKIPSDENLWNRLYFIGHSLGAHISGQTGSFLKNDTFWTVERITGLDPAKPCFSDTDSASKLDKEDAKFVDVIHTQIGTDDSNGLGLAERSGHVDFYINTGIMQPGCPENKWMDILVKKDISKMVCSHKLAYTYFTNAVAKSVNGGCSFKSYPWNGTYEDAKSNLGKRINDKFCPDCPQVGLGASNSTKTGSFIVITTDSGPYCLLNQDREEFNIVTEIIEKLRGAQLIFTRDERS